MSTTAPAAPRARSTAPWAGLAATGVLVALAVAVPLLTGWEVHARSDEAGGFSVPPLHGTWDPKLLGPGTVPALVIAGLGWRYAVDLAGRLPWRHLLLATYVAGLAWLLSLALVDGWSGITRAVGHPYGFLATAGNVDDVPAMLREFVPRIDPDNERNWTTHVAGHPPLALLVFVALARVGLGGSSGAGVVIVLVAASIVPAVLTTVRTLGAEDAARRAAPFLTLGPAAVFLAVSEDALFAAAAAWGLAVLAVAGTRTHGPATLGWSVAAGVLLGGCVLLSYGLILLGPLALAVLWVARSWRPLPIAAAAALALVLCFAVAGFAWWEAYPEVAERYWRGLAADRPPAYWMWGDLAALAVCAGPLFGAGLAMLRRGSDRVVLGLAGAGCVAIALADLSQMSRAEVERIWLPFVPWLLLSTALLPERWRRAGLGLQLGFALLVQQLLYTSW